MTDPDWLAARFEEQRPHLRSVAYRMLGSLAEAEDTVQDAWLRASRADASQSSARALRSRAAAAGCVAVPSLK